MTVIKLPPREKGEDTLGKSFVPLTGNPENGDYSDFLKYLEESNDKKPAENPEDPQKIIHLWV
jgi:hypothetical protein